MDCRSITDIRHNHVSHRPETSLDLNHHPGNAKHRLVSAPLFQHQPTCQLLNISEIKPSTLELQPRSAIQAMEFHTTHTVVTSYGKCCVHVTAYVVVRRSLSTTYTAVGLGLLLRQYVSYQFGVWAVQIQASVYLIHVCPKLLFMDGAWKLDAYAHG